VRELPTEGSCEAPRLVTRRSHAGSLHRRFSFCWEGYRGSRRCSRDTYPESYITKHTSIRSLSFCCRDLLQRIRRFTKPSSRYAKLLAASLAEQMQDAYTVGFYGVAVSYKRGNPVGGSSPLSSPVNVAGPHPQCAVFLPF